jgi:hypothetical protein
VFAIGLVIWGVSLRTLTSDQQRLLVWALALAAGFAASAITGTFNADARNLIPGISITASSGCAVWLITFFFLFPESKVKQTSPEENTTTSTTSPLPSATIVITPPPTTTPAVVVSFSPISSPNPSSTALSQDQVQALWNVIIYRVRHSRLVESYVPDQVYAAQLINAVRDNEDIHKLLKKFEDQVKDETLQK